VCAVLPSGGKVVRLEELEAAQLSPLSKSSLIPTSSSTPDDGTVSSSTRANVLSDSSRGTKQHIPVPVSGAAHGHAPPGPAPTLPAGAQVQTLEQIEAGLRSVNISSSPVNKTAAAGGDLSAFNKLLHLVNKSHPVNDQACGLHCQH